MTNTGSNNDDHVKTNKVKKITNILLGMIISLLLFNLTANRMIPMTDTARIKGFIIPIKAQIQGQILDIKVTPNQLVEQGDLLVSLDPKDYEIAVKQAEQQLAIAGQSVGAQTAAVTASQARLTKALIEKKNTELQSKRILAMADKGIVSKAQADKARALLATATANVANAHANLEKSKQQLGNIGEDNNKIKSALLALEKAQLNLERTEIHAPTRGGISNFSLSKGFYASAGQPIMTFVSTESIWIEAYYRENSMGNIRLGDMVEISLDSAPGKIIKGKVSMIDWGVDWGENDQAGKLAKAHFQTGWLRQTQMLPIAIEFDLKESKGLLRIGGQADVIVYTGDDSLINILFNTIGKIWIRLISWLSYVR